MHSTLQLVRLLNSRDRWPALFRHAASGSRRIAQHAPPYPLPCQAVNALRPAVPGIKNIRHGLCVLKQTLFYQLCGRTFVQQVSVRVKHAVKPYLPHLGAGPVVRFCFRLWLLFFPF